MKFVGLVALAAICQTTTAFQAGQQQQQIKKSHRNSIQLKVQSSEESDSSRRDFFAKAGATALSIASSSGLGFGVLAPPAANAVSGVNKVSDRLKA